MTSTATDSDAEWDAIRVLVASSYRRRTATALADGPATPAALSDRTGIEITHISRALTELRDHDPALAELLVPEDTAKGRIYQLTQAGEQALERAQEVTA